MKLRIARFLKVVKNPIGLSMLDVVSNALASILLLFFVMIAIRSQPPVPERQVGILMVDYELQTAEPEAEIEVFLQRPEKSPSFEREVAEDLKTQDINSIPGIWGHAVVLAKPGREKTHRRIFYMNPEKDGEWRSGIIYADHSKLTERSFQPGASLTLRAYFISGSPKLGTWEKKSQVNFPTQLSGTKFDIPSYGNAN
ncbi:MAG: hypothetical protein AAB316_17180 [Bacteroidota bacterium]